MDGSIRRAIPEDAPVLASVAAATFPLACPPHTRPASIAAFIASTLTEAHFDGYLRDPGRIVLIAEDAGAVVGYAMLVQGEPADPATAAAVAARPTIELSKFYVVPERHGTGVASELMAAVLAEAVATRAASVWLGVNQLNARANSFYAKNGFREAGTRRFRVGDRLEEDFVRERTLSPAPR